MNLQVKPKEAAWSYSRLKAFDDCPRRYHEVSVKKAWPEPDSDMLREGNDIHKAMATALRNGTKLPARWRVHQKWVDQVAAGKGEMLIEEECKWAITRDFQPTTWFADDVWLRCIADVVRLNPPVALIIDWKWGKSANVDAMQLTLTSLMLLVQFPELHAIRGEFIWLQENKMTTQNLRRTEAADYWAELMPRVERLQKATFDEHFPPQPGRFCKRWCPVKSCEHWGK